MTEETPKKKPHTSAAVKNRYNAKNYRRIGIMLAKDLVENFKEKCKEKGISQAQVLKEAIEAFLAA